MESTINVKIITPSALALESMASEILLPGQNGLFGVLPMHENLIANLKPGIVLVHEESGQLKYFVYGGIARIHNFALTISTSYAVDLVSINQQQVQDQVEKYKCEMRNASVLETSILSDKLECLNHLLRFLK